MSKTLEIYCMKKFPQISITGKLCALNCKHCKAHYLKSMITATTPEKFVKICKELDKKAKK